MVGLLASLLRVLACSLVQGFSPSASEDLGRDGKEAEGAGLPQRGTLGLEGLPLELGGNGGLERALWQA